MVWAASTIIALGATAVGAGVAINNTNKAIKSQEQSGRDASQTAITAQREAQAFQQKQSDQARADREPWRAQGVNKLAELGQRTAPGGDLMRSFGMADFQKDPGYEFRQAEGMKGINNSAAARGSLLSGAALKAASRYNQDFASNEFGNASNRFVTNQTNQFNRLASLADVGQVAANQNASGSMQLGSSVGNALMNTGGFVGGNQIGSGNARASGYLAQGNNLVGALNQGVSMWKNANTNNQNALYNSPNNYGGGYNPNGTFSPNTYGDGSNPYAGYDANAAGGWGGE